MSGEQRTGPSTSHEGVSADAPAPLADEDQARADFYGLFAHLLLAPPNAELLAALAAADPVAAAGEFALEDAWLKLTQAASVVDAALVADEFSALFISTGTPLLNPYASFYLTGHLNDAPLAALRHDLARLGLARAPGVGEFEDHLGTLCETMRVLIQGGPGMRPRGLSGRGTPRAWPTSRALPTRISTGSSPASSTPSCRSKRKPSPCWIPPTRSPHEDHHGQ
jgi:TorA maturation chaperone TorD